MQGSPFLSPAMGFSSITSLGFMFPFQGNMSFVWVPIHFQGSKLILVFPLLSSVRFPLPFQGNFVFYGTAEVAPRKASGSRDASSHGAGHDMHIFGQQVPGFIGSGEPDQARSGEKPNSLTYLLKSVILGSRSPDPVKGVVKREQGSGGHEALTKRVSH